jgi:hypothetical protein
LPGRQQEFDSFESVHSFVLEESEQRPLTWLAPLATLSPRERAVFFDLYAFLGERVMVIDLYPLPWGEGVRGTRAGEGAFGPCCFRTMAT